MRIEIDNKSWYDITDFDDYEEIEELGEITGTIGIPDCVDIESDWDSIQEYLGLSDNEQAIMIAYAEANSVFDWEEAMEAYVGNYTDGAEFAQTMSEELGYIPEVLPSWIAYHIDWQAVWDCELCYDYFKFDGHFFRNL
ncbi:MAG: antirestriction protein ArdA [Veillonella sp.]|nr:antirestriction protein ArdA [Veillonella sp.]